MAYDEDLAQRVREVLADRPDLTERTMFGGLAFMVGGHMCCGIVGDELMVRTGSEQYEAALGQPHARKMAFTGRSMRGMVYVGTEGIRDDEDLEAWVCRGVDYAAGLPPKAK